MGMGPGHDGQSSGSYHLTGPSGGKTRGSEPVPDSHLCLFSREATRKRGSRPMADFRLSYLPALFYYNATLENLIVGTFLPHNGSKPLGMQPKHGDDSEPVLGRLALLKAGSEGRPRHFLRFPPLLCSISLRRAKM